MPRYSSWLDPLLIWDEMVLAFWPTAVVGVVWSLFRVRRSRRPVAPRHAPFLWPWWIWALQANGYLRWWALGHSSFEHESTFIAAAVLHATVITLSLLIPALASLPGLLVTGRAPSRLHLVSTLILVTGVLAENALVLALTIHLTVDRLA